MPNGIPDKGRVLTGLSTSGSRISDVPNHLISTDIDDAGIDLTPHERESLDGPLDAGTQGARRSVRVRGPRLSLRQRLEGIPRDGPVCGITLPAGLVESDRIDPIFTPATKAETGPR